MYRHPASEIFSNNCITSNICSNARCGSEAKILFSCNADRVNELKVFSFENGQRFSEYCNKRLGFLTNITMWVPDTEGNYIDAIATLHSNIKFFRLDENRLRPMFELLENDYCNPIISADWNSCHLEQIAALRNDGTCIVLNYNIPSPGRNETYTYNFFDCCSVCFGRGVMQHSLFQVYRSGFLSFIDMRINWLNNLYHFPEDKVKSIKYSMNNEYMMAFLSGKMMKVMDVRMKREINHLKCNDMEEYKCFCWSPNSDKLFLGTSTGRIIEWSLTDCLKSYDPAISSVSTVNTIHCPSLLPHALLFSGLSENIDSVKFLN